MQFFEKRKLFMYRYERMGKIHLVKKAGYRVTMKILTKGKGKEKIYIFGYLSNITCPWEWEVSGWEQV